MPELSRREFLLIGAASGAAVAVGVVVPLSLVSRDDSPDGEIAGPAAVVTIFPRTKIAQLSSLRQGELVMFDYPLPGQASVLVKMGNQAVGGAGPDEDVVAFSRICTHMGCVLEDFRSDHGVLGPCPCHFSTFDLARNGQVTLGQATQNLPQVLLQVDGDEIYATGVIRLIYGHSNTLQSAATATA